MNIQHAYNILSHYINIIGDVNINIIKQQPRPLAYLLFLVFYLFLLLIYTICKTLFTIRICAR